MANTGNGFRGSQPGGSGARGGRDVSGGQRPPQQRPQQQTRPAQRSSGFVYRERSVESLKALAERQNSRFDSIYKAGVPTWKPKQGFNIVRYMPPTWDNAEHYALTVWVHSYIGPDQGSYLCLSKMLGKPCPICRSAHEAKQAGDEEEARKNGASERMLAWILDREGEDPTKPQMWNMSWSQGRDVAALCHNRRTGAPLWIDNPDVGYDVSFQRVGTTMKNTRYFGYQVDRDPSPIASDVRVQDQILQLVSDNPIPSVLQYYPAEYLMKALLGTTQAVPDTNEASALLSAGEEETYEEGVDYTYTEGAEQPWEPEPEPEPELEPEPRQSRATRFSDRIPLEPGDRDPRERAPVERQRMRPR